MHPSADMALWDGKLLSVCMVPPDDMAKMDHMATLAGIALLDDTAHSADMALLDGMVLLADMVPQDDKVLLADMVPPDDTALLADMVPLDGKAHSVDMDAHHPGFHHLRTNLLILGHKRIPCYIHYPLISLQTINNNLVFMSTTYCMN